MGEYSRLNKMLVEHESEIFELKEQLYEADNDYEREYLLDRIHDLEVGKGEIEGALLEMAEVDGLDDKYEAFDYHEDTYESQHPYYPFMYGEC